MLFLTHTYSTIEYYKIFNIDIYEDQNIRLHERSYACFLFRSRNKSRYFKHRSPLISNFYYLT